MPVLAALPLCTDLVFHQHVCTDRAYTAFDSVGMDVLQAQANMECFEKSEGAPSAVHACGLPMPFADLYIYGQNNEHSVLFLKQALQCLL